jgi:hypothetical protein
MRSSTLLKTKVNAAQCNMSFDNDEDLHTWHWDNITSEQCKKPLADFYFSLLAHEQDLYTYCMDHPELRHMSFQDIGLSKQERAQAFDTHSTSNF